MCAGAVRLRQLVGGERAVERLADARVERDPRARGADRDLGRAVAPLGADVERAAAHQRVDRDRARG